MPAVTWRNIAVAALAVAAVLFPNTTPHAAGATPRCAPPAPELARIRHQATLAARLAAPDHIVRYPAWRAHYRKLLTAWQLRCWQRARTVTGTAVASYYGPGLWGNGTASGSTLRYGDGTVAHRSMPFGTVCSFSSGHARARGTVRDRGPFVDGRTFDLEQSLAERMHLSLGVVTYVCVMPRR